jgi:hypothetical protein
MLLAALAAAGCGSNGIPPGNINTSAHWNDDPGTVAAIGYSVAVEIVWPSRGQDCFSLPSDLTVAVNDQQLVGQPPGDCSSWDLQFDAIAPDAPVTVRMFSGSHLYGEAIYDGLFPGFGAQVAAASNSQVSAGGQIEVILPAGEVAADPTVLWGQFHWTDPGSAGVPFRSYAPATAGPDPQSVLVTAPSNLTGAAMLVIEGELRATPATIESCTGFETCLSGAVAKAAGPVSVVVTP